MHDRAQQFVNSGAYYYVKAAAAVKKKYLQNLMLAGVSIDVSSSVMTKGLHLRVQDARIKASRHNCRNWHDAQQASQGSVLRSTHLDCCYRHLLVTAKHNLVAAHAPGPAAACYTGHSIWTLCIQ